MVNKDINDVVVQAVGIVVAMTIISGRELSTELFSRALLAVVVVIILGSILRKVLKGI